MKTREDKIKEIAEILSEVFNEGYETSEHGIPREPDDFKKEANEIYSIVAGISEVAELDLETGHLRRLDNDNG